MTNYSSSKYVDSSNTPWYKVLQLISEKSIVLDIGCSSGNFGEVLIQKKKCTVDGVEIAEEDIILAKKKLRNVYSFNIEDGVPEKLNGKYDYVYYGDVIEHLVNPVTALKNTKKLLKKDGQIVFSIPNMAHVSVRMMLLEGRFDYGLTGLLDNTHLHFYTKNEIERVFAEAGYAITKIDWVERDIPKDVIEKKLINNGLTANKDFYDKTKTIDWAAYQYIGLATKSNKSTIVKREKVSPLINEFENQVNDLNKAHKEEIKRVVAHYENLILNLRKEYEVKLNQKIRAPKIVLNLRDSIRKKTANK